jgi:hypothetical protein
MSHTRAERGELRIFHQNVRSLRQRYDELLCYVQGRPTPYQLIVLSEIWVFDNEADRYAIPGYQLIIQHRPNNASGGVAVYVHNELSFHHQCFLFSHAEVIKIVINKLFNNSTPVSLELFCIYNESSRNSFSNFKDDLENNILKPSGKFCILIGDLNINTLHKGNEETQYLSLLASYGFKNIVNEPTREVDNSISCLDHVIVKNSSQIVVKSKVEKLGLSDHHANIVSCKVSCPVKTVKYCKYVDYNILNRKINIAHWQSVYECNLVNDALEKFYSLYNTCLEDSSFLRVFNSKNRQRSPWITNSLINKVNMKNKLYKLVKMDRNKHNLDLIRHYKVVSKDVNILIRKAKLKYYSDKIEAARGNSKQYWQVVRSVLRAERQQLTHIDVGGTTYEVPGNELFIADAFNDYFVNIPSKLLENEFGQNVIPLPKMDTFRLNNFSFNEVTIYDIIKIILSMKNKKSTGPDEISVLVLKNNIEILAPVVTYIFNLSVVQGIFPDKLKLACVVPIFKTNNRQDMSNYRPISLINTLAKVFEKCMQKQLVEHFNSNNLFSPKQYGFLRGKSTDCAIDQHIRYIVHSVDNLKPTVATYVDFSKAFDLVDRNILLYKLKCYGVTGTAYSWIESFLMDRQQVVRINGVLSRPRYSNHGVPQGGVLGPLLFVIFINDLLGEEFVSDIVAYADDITLVTSGSSIQRLENRVNRDLELLSNWVCLNKLIINTNKTKSILFCYKSSKFEEEKSRLKLYCHKFLCSFGCDCLKLEVVSQIRYLGLIIDFNLKWNYHIDYLLKKLRAINRNLYYMKQYLKEGQLKTLYFSWYEATLRYGMIHWGGTYPTILEPILISQRMTLRTLCGVRRYDSAQPLFKQLNILKFSELYLLSIFQYFKSYFHFFQIKVSNRFTRSVNSIQLSVPNIFKQTSRNQFHYKSITIFNKFSKLLDFNKSNGVFKLTVKQLILDGKIFLPT